MKNQILFTFCFLLIVSFVHSQDATTSSPQEIDMKVRALGYRFYQDGERLTWNELTDATNSVEEANKLIQRAKSQNTLSNILAFAGGALIGIPLGQKAADSDPTWELAYIGGGTALIGFHLALRAFNNVNKGVDDYNLTINSTAQYKFQPEIKVLANSNGFGLAIGF
ncbi:hypothetical protein [Flagellimonas flava]|uniref:Outer membrane protein beta-barrel domain-containing protein n=1 Tax=Flagellimonas flava TaxID=570519 RepID=A0A1M5JVY8_9FLAO|nr:hypothetical protein [Allomuricauda flava]SHG44399.1 hypothetical protein SAMN04488116_1234 [Allomuricauda flava]